MSTKGQIVEQILRILNGGEHSTRSRYWAEEVAASLGGVLSTLLKAQMFETVYNTDGESIPDGAMIATYENIQVFSRDKKRCRVRLPAIPMSIPERMGVFSVYPSGYPELEYIPIPAGTINILSGEKILSSLGNKTYSWDSREITIHSDTVGAGVDTVDMKLCVGLDMSTYGDNDMLPIPSDMEAQAIQMVVQMYQGEPQTTREETKAPSPNQITNR